MRACIRGLLVGMAACGASVAQAWVPQGHQTVGAIADALLAGTPAGLEVRRILGAGATLKTAALWADCAKSVVRDPGTGEFQYVVNAKYMECRPFETPAGQKAMESFVRRNWDSCRPAAGEEPCHKQYHYADVAFEREAYARTDIGTSDHDIVSAILAAVAVLQGGSAPAPFDIASRKEALRMLAHYVGDLHQPLHVGSIYLDAGGREVDPDGGHYDPATRNQGGNLLLDGSQRLHGEWDAIPASLGVAQFRTAGAAAARRVPVTRGPLTAWPALWATESVLASHRAFQTLTFGAQDAATKTWPVTEPDGYAAAQAALQKTQIVKAGARLAQLLEAIYP